MITPVLEIFTISENGFSILRLYIFRIKNKIIEVNNTLYQTKVISLGEISFSKTPVKPSSKIAACSIK